MSCDICKHLLFRGTACWHCGKGKAHQDCIDPDTKNWLCSACVNKQKEYDTLADEGRIRTPWNITDVVVQYFCVNKVVLDPNNSVCVSWKGYTSFKNTIYKTNELRMFPYATCGKQKCLGHTPEGTFVDETYDSHCYICHDDMEGRPSACCEFTITEACKRICCRPCTERQCNGIIPEIFYCKPHQTYIDNIKYPLRVLSLCSGICVDLLSILFNQYQVDVYVFVDIDDNAKKVAQHFQKRHPSINMIFLDNVQSLEDARRLIEDLDNQYEFNCVIAGTPCQSFSRANNFGAGFNDSRGRLFYFFTNIIHYLKKCKPRQYLLTIWENVLSSYTNREVVEKELENLGLKLVIIDAKDWSCVRRKRAYGINQNIDEKLINPKYTPQCIKLIESLKDLLSDPQTSEIIDGKKYANCYTCSTKDNHVFRNQKSKKSRELSVPEAICSQFIEELELEQLDFSKGELHQLVGNAFNAAVLSCIFKTQQYKLIKSERWLLNHYKPATTPTKKTSRGRKRKLV